MKNRHRVYRFENGVLISHAGHNNDNKGTIWTDPNDLDIKDEEKPSFVALWDYLELLHELAIKEYRTHIIKGKPFNGEFVCYNCACSYNIDYTYNFVSENEKECISCGKILPCFQFNWSAE